MVSMQWFPFIKSSCNIKVHYTTTKYPNLQILLISYFTLNETDKVNKLVVFVNLPLRASL